MSRYNFGKQDLKSLSLLFFLVYFFYSCSIDQKQQPVALSNGVDSLSYYTGVFAASTIKDMGGTELNTEVFCKAVLQVLEGNETLITKADADYNIGWHFKKLKAQQAEQNLKKGQAFLQKNKTAAHIVSTKSGLQYKVIKKGEGKHPLQNDKVVVNIKGTTLEGDIFMEDNGLDTLLLRKGNIIEGWYEGLQLMKEGSKFMFYIPAELAFGVVPVPLPYIKPQMALIFEVELVKIIEEKRWKG